MTAAMAPDELFLRYAYSCAEVQRDHLHAVTDGELAKVRRMLDREDATDDAFLKSVYPAAFRRLELIAKETKSAPLTTETLDAYFIVYHNAFIDAGDGSYAKLPRWTCEYCKVHVARVTEVLVQDGHRAFRIEPYEHAVFRQAGVSGDLVPEAKAGDLVVIHQGWAVKTVEPSYYERLKKAYQATKLFSGLTQKAQALRS